LPGAQHLLTELARQATAGVAARKSQASFAPYVVDAAQFSSRDTSRAKQRNRVFILFLKGFAERFQALELTRGLHVLATMPVGAALTVPRLALFDSLRGKYSDPNS
jgi:hypothetical protein